MKTRLTQKLEGKTIAIVGSSDVDKDYSAEIDSADVVIRFNHFYNYDSGKVGKKVDIVLQTVAGAWFDAVKENRAHIDIVKAQRPNVVLVKRPDHYTTDVHAIYGDQIRIDNLAFAFEPWAKFTTGTAALCYLAANLENAKVRCYGFATGDDPLWQKYLETDAKHYQGTATEERPAQQEAIRHLESLEITAPPKSIPACIVVPIKATSTGVPGKNRKLLRRCLETLQALELPLYVTGDDIELFHEVKDLATVVALPAIPAYDDVTKTVRKWQVETGFMGDIALTQCTAPFLKPEWVVKCFEALGTAPLSAICVKPDFKPSALYRKENGVFVPCSQALPATSVARQLLPETALVTGAVVAFHTDALRNESLYQCGVLNPVYVPNDEGLDVDTPKQMEEALKHI